jgi:uncharacterized protein (DUF608 family)
MQTDSRWITAVMAAIVCLVVVVAARAQQPAATTPSPFDASLTVRDNLRRLQEAKKAVEVVLKNGKSYRGSVATVGDHAVLLTEIQGREFYDALVVLDEIAALEVRARNQ